MVFDCTPRPLYINEQGMVNPIAPVFFVVFIVCVGASSRAAWAMSFDVKLFRTAAGGSRGGSDVVYYTPHVWNAYVWNKYVDGDF